MSPFIISNINDFISLYFIISGYIHISGKANSLDPFIPSPYLKLITILNLAKYIKNILMHK